MPMSDEEAVVEQAAIAGIGTKVFGKWDATGFPLVLALLELALLPPELLTITLHLRS